MRSILITDKNDTLDGIAFPMPWKYDVNCYNFKRPTEIIKTSEIDSIENPEEVISLITGSNLTDYSFIAKMKNLRQLYIYKGDEHLTDLSFITDLIYLNHLVVGASYIKDVDPLKELLAKKVKLLEKEKEFTRKMMIWLDCVYIRSVYEITEELLEEEDQKLFSELHIRQYIPSKE